MPLHAAPGHDYVLIARAATIRRPFAALLGDLETALRRLGAWRDPEQRRRVRPVVNAVLQGLIRLYQLRLAADPPDLSLLADLLRLRRRGDRAARRGARQLAASDAWCGAIPGAAAAMTRCRPPPVRIATRRSAHGPEATPQHHPRDGHLAGDSSWLPVLRAEANATAKAGAGSANDPASTRRQQLAGGVAPRGSWRARRAW